MSETQKTLWPCRVCGFDQRFDIWGGDENLNCTYDICDCCGAEAGTDDFDLEAVRRYREKWQKEGLNWFVPEAKPENWSFDEQFLNVPERWK